MKNFILTLTFLSLVSIINPCYAALVLGTNCGFVSEAPTADPNGTDIEADKGNARTAVKHTTSAGTTTITEVGWYCDNATPAANFEVGLYTDEGNNEPETRLYRSSTAAKGTTSGWKSIAVDWSVDASTTYWIAFYLQNTTPATNTNRTLTGGVGGANKTYSNGGLPTDWGASTWSSWEAKFAIYAVEQGAVRRAFLISKKERR